MKYSLRSLMIVVLVLPPVLAIGIAAAVRLLAKPDRVPEAGSNNPLLALALLMSGAVAVAGILDYRRWPTTAHLVITVYALVVFAFILGMLTLP
jgi:hypothetical protein